MICKKCGHDNNDYAKFCESCGSKLEKDNIKENEINNSDTARLDGKEIKIASLHRQSSEKRIKLSDKKDSLVSYIIIGFVGFIILLVFIIMFINIKNDGNKGINQTSQDIVEDSDKYIGIINDANKAIASKDYQSAVSLLESIPKEAGDYYRDSQKQISTIEDAIIEELSEYVANEDYRTARNLAEFYLEILPQSKRIMDIRKEVIAKIEDNQIQQEQADKKLEEKEDKLGQKEVENAYDLDQLRKNNSYGKNGNPEYVDIYSKDDFLNKSFRINTDKGQLRSAASLDSRVIGNVYDGESVYVEDVVSDGSRYWLNIGKGWISSKLVTGEFR